MAKLSMINVCDRLTSLVQMFTLNENETRNKVVTRFIQLKLTAKLRKMEAHRPPRHTVGKENSQ